MLGKRNNRQDQSYRAIPLKQIPPPKDRQWAHESRSDRNGHQDSLGGRLRLLIVSRKYPALFNCSWMSVYRYKFPNLAPTHHRGRVV